MIDWNKYVVPRAGIEPALPKKSDFESDVSTSFTTPAQKNYILYVIFFSMTTKFYKIVLLIFEPYERLIRCT